MINCQDNKWLNIIVILTLISNTFGLHFGYHDYESIVHLLKNFQKKFPNKCHMYSIGKSVKLKELWVVAISDTSPHTHVQLRPETKLISNIHGNEMVSNEILLHFIEHMLSYQNKDSNVDYIMKNTRIHILVSMNPDGLEISSKSESDCSSLKGRFNANGYDLNRNFPRLNCNYFNDELQKETTAIITWLENNHFILSANLHSGTLGIYIYFKGELWLTN